MVAKLPEEEHPRLAFGWAARDQSGVLSPFKFSRRFFSFLPFLHTFIYLFSEIRKLIWVLCVCVCLCRGTGEKDVCVKVLYCGMCHSDLHKVKNEWGTSTYPLVPGYVPTYICCLRNLLIDRFFNINICLILLCSCLQAWNCWSGDWGGKQGRKIQSWGQGGCGLHGRIVSILR